MKAMLISEIFPPTHGGSGRWFWELYSRLPRDEYVLAVGTSQGYQDFDKTHDLTIERLDLSSASWGIKSLSGIKFYWRTFKELRRLIKTHQIKQLHCGRCLPEGFMAYILNRVYGLPYKCFIHGEDVETAALSRELSWIIRQVFHRADALICNSQNTANLLLNKWGTSKDKTIVLHPGVDTTRFIPAERSIDVRNQLGWQDRPVILTVGRLQERKGHDVLIEAMVEIKKTIPDILYSIIGNGERKELLLAKVKKLGLEENVQFFNEISDEQMIQAYQQCDLFVLPNRQVGNDIEGFGMVLVEAQACGKPVIAGDSGGTAETMAIDKTGFIIDCTTPKPIIEKCRLLLSDKAQLQQLGVNARTFSVNHFDWMTLSSQAKGIFIK